jgi:ABC-2 type transport system permease protein
MSSTISRFNPLRVMVRNPVALKELRGRMRGSRAFVVMTIYLGLVIFFMALAYATQIADHSVMTSNLNGGEIGRLMFAVVIYVELLLVMFITPTVTTNAISGEHERQTYDLLRTTLLPERSLVGGKLFSALAYILLLLLATIPLQSIALVFGGVALNEIIVLQLVLLMTAVFFGAVGIYFSAVTRRTLRANMLTYVMIIGIIVVPVILLLGGQTLFNSGVSSSTQILLVIVGGILVAINPVAAIFTSQQLLQQQQSLWLFEAQLQNGTTITLPMPWVVFTLFYLVMTVIIFVITTLRLKRIDQV